jgi:hypothetical protein
MAEERVTRIEIRNGKRFVVEVLPEAGRRQMWARSGSKAKQGGQLAARARSQRDWTYRVSCQVCQQPAGHPCRNPNGTVARAHTVRRIKGRQLKVEPT